MFGSEVFDSIMGRAPRVLSQEAANGTFWARQIPGRYGKKLLYLKLTFINIFINIYYYINIYYIIYYYIILYYINIYNIIYKVLYYINIYSIFLLFVYELLLTLLIQVY